MQRYEAYIRIQLQCPVDNTQKTTIKTHTLYLSSNNKARSLSKLIAVGVCNETPQKITPIVLIKGNYEEVVDTLPAYINFIYNYFIVDNFLNDFLKAFLMLK